MAIPAKRLAHHDMLLCSAVGKMEGVQVGKIVSCESQESVASGSSRIDKDLGTSVIPEICGPYSSSSC